MSATPNCSHMLSTNVYVTSISLLILLTTYRPLVRTQKCPIFNSTLRLWNYYTTHSPPLAFPQVSIQQNMTYFIGQHSLPVSLATKLWLTLLAIKHYFLTAPYFAVALDFARKGFKKFYYCR